MNDYRDFTMDLKKDMHNDLAKLNDKDRHIIINIAMMTLATTALGVELSYHAHELIDIILKGLTKQLLENLDEMRKENSCDCNENPPNDSR
jgi:hypothetical protein